MMYRQGDILLKKVNYVTAFVERKDNVLATGEATGHSHRFETDQAEVVINKRGRQYAILKTECSLIHEEHAALAIPMGAYEVILKSGSGQAM